MEWRVIPGLRAYEVSDSGDVRRIATGTRMRGFIDADGYVRYQLRDDSGIKVVRCAHAFVAAAFISRRPSKQHQVAHNNGSRLNNYYKNLRWVLPVENVRDRTVHGTAPVGVGNPRATITDQDVLDIRRAYREIKRPKSGRCVAELDEKYGLCRSHIIRIARGQAWAHLPMEIEL